MVRINVKVTSYCCEQFIISCFVQNLRCYVVVIECTANDLVTFIIASLAILSSGW